MNNITLEFLVTIFYITPKYFTLYIALKKVDFYQNKQIAMTFQNISKSRYSCRSYKPDLLEQEKLSLLFEHFALRLRQ